MISDEQRRTLDRFAEDAARSLGSALRAVVLYGEAAADDGASGAPLTVMLAVDAATVPLLRTVADLSRRWQSSDLALPLVLDEDYLTTSCDVFPLELLALQDTHVLLHGDDDPLAAICIDREHLRLEVEQQLKGKVLHLRQAFLETVGDRRALGELMIGSSAFFETIMRGLLMVADAPRGTSTEICAEVERVLGIELETFRKVQAARRNGLLDDAGAELLFERYLDELAALARIADRITRP